MQAIILAGGFGTRLQSVIKELPKTLAPINGKPFLYWLIQFLQKQGVTEFVFSLGYLNEQIDNFLAQEFPSLKYFCIVEKRPLGTGGAIKLCLEKIETEDVLIFNGDSFFDLDLTDFFNFFKITKADCSIAIKVMENFDRYGTVELDENNLVTQFVEKKHCEIGFINTGITAIKKSVYLEKTIHLSENFSYEKDFLEPNIAKLKITGFQSHGYFIDIGIPADYEKAKKDLSGLLNR